MLYSSGGCESEVETRQGEGGGKKSVHRYLFLFFPLSVLSLFIVFYLVSVFPYCPCASPFRFPFNILDPSPSVLVHPILSANRSPMPCSCFPVCNLPYVLLHIMLFPFSFTIKTIQKSCTFFQALPVHRTVLPLKK